ncbi:hypothetical protein D9619_001881 [Psilocybe cf. subviscida]|uniref:Cation efflux protein transmembrane domain-containing protein n=1 Tax=Psilocybe cf. subviscida TaxID=2480587 RepID=A0A8H5BEW4_9AGAR|nr:hypothetical protein D9619_001881 [Psilocybe cf. subviscida]
MTPASSPSVTVSRPRVSVCYSPTLVLLAFVEPSFIPLEPSFETLQILTERIHLLADFVTPLCWKLSWKPPSEAYPYGYEKFETVGTKTISILPIGDALDISFHSYHFLIEALSESASTRLVWALPGIPSVYLFERTNLPAHLGQKHTHGVNINTLGSAGSIARRGWSYRITKKVADEEHNLVLFANAIHHRSDAYWSLVAFFAIIGASSRQCDLTNAGVPARTRKAIWKLPGSLVDKTGSTT